jgi:gliding motility-associated-like protein
LYVSFTATSVPTAQNYVWNMGNSTTSTNPNPNTIYFAPGQYNVSVTITDVNGCTNSKNNPNLVTANPKPNVDFSVSPIDVGYVSEEIIFTSTYSGSNSNWVWNFGDGTSVIEQDPVATHHYGMAGVLNVTHIVINEFGCSDTITKPYTVFTRIIIPNILTPNNDGLNDSFIIDGLQFVEGARLKVYNRWGKKIYDNSSYKNDWNGENAPDGVYFYTLTLPEFLKTGPYSGSLTLLH